jgi:hypothetical protein
MLNANIIYIVNYLIYLFLITTAICCVYLNIPVTHGTESSYYFREK